MRYDTQQAIARAVEALRAIAADLERAPTPGEDRAEYEQHVATRLRGIADALELASETSE